jgi:putative hydrolase
MANRPFGFSMPDKPEDGGGGGSSGGDPLGGAAGGPQQFADALRQFADMLSWTGGPVNWDLAKNVARHAISAAGDPSILDAQRRDVIEAIRTADLWLDEPSSFPSGVRKIEAWSRSEWLEATFPVWAKLCDPIAAKGVEAMSSMIPTDPGQLGEDVPEELRSMLGALGGGSGAGMGGLAGLGAMFRQIGGAMIGGQTGTAVGELAREVIGSADIGLPLGPEGTAALLPAGVAEFGQGLSVDAREVRLYVALREAAHQRLFAHVPWLRARLLGAVEQYASGITMDMAKLQEAMPEVDITNPEALQQALQGEALFRPEDTPAQKAALSRLETMLALVEGWVSTVVAAAADGRLTHADALAEAVRRRRATGGPAERTFATLVGLELRPRRMREAAAIWRGLTEARGIDGRDALWGHPDLLPAADDLEDPDQFVRGSPELDISDLEDGSGEEPTSLYKNGVMRVADAIAFAGHEVHVCRYREAGTLLRWLGADLRGLRVLDVAGGDGYWAARARRRGARAVALDISADKLRRGGSMSVVPGLVRGDALRLPFPDASFDRVMSICAIEHFDDGERALDEMARVLRPGGELVMSADALTLAKRWPRLYAAHCERYSVQRTYSRDELAGLLAARGLVVEAHEYQFRGRWAQRMYLSLSAYGGTFGFNAAAPVLPVVALSDRLGRGHDGGAIVLVHARRAHVNAALRQA